MSAPTYESKQVPFDSIELGTRQRRVYGDIRELAESIKTKGLMHNLVVRVNGDKFSIIAGGRRYRAIEMLRADGEVECWQQVWVNVWSKDDITEYELQALELEENVQRQQLTEAERLLAQKQLHLIWTAQGGGPKESTRQDAEGHSMTDTAKRLGMPKSTLSHELKLANMLEVLPGMKDKKDLKKSDIEKVMKFVAKKAESAAASIKAQKAIEGKTANELQQQTIDGYIVGDFFDNLKRFPDNSFDLVEIDWPFAADLNEMKNSANETGLGEYDEIPREEYPLFVKKVLAEAYRMAKKDASWLIVWFGPDWFNLIFEEIIAANFISRTLPGVWVKERGQTMRPELYHASGYEMFFVGRLGNAELVRQGRLNTFIYNTIPSQRKIHVTEKPIDMLVDLFSTMIHPGSNIAVPFLGSGASLLAAADMKCTAVGCDLSSHHFNRFISERATIAQPGFYAAAQRDFKKNDGTYALSAYEQAVARGDIELDDESIDEELEEGITE